ncbi:MAG: ATP-binding protein [FCB group bacterium]|nr:ATP-binding protein [FCB group bacterium]MBL7029513.1 ATP-binding protein [Candidatus Neomarinimicrobiota bacterium]MBL7122948.1 ATP-binding protein [Candidatus Neomarinimicrobiota bacterium]
MIQRSMVDSIHRKMFGGKAIIVLGARQVGKTTLINELVLDSRKDVLSLNGDDSDVRSLLEDVNINQLIRLIGDKNILFIAEAQRIPDIGLVIKICVDRINHVQVIATGSSSFELLQSIQEPLTGRAWQWIMYPLSFQELRDHSDLLTEKRLLNERLVFGSYPDIINNPNTQMASLKLLTGSYLYRDLERAPGVARPELLEKITRALALQIGSEVSSTEIARLVGADRLTIEKYINLLEKAFIIFRLPALNRNIRNEIKMGRKFYFYDNGVRNAVINNFSPVHSRADVGALWENYCVAERIKLHGARENQVQSYFWRTTQQQEIDLIEEDSQANLSVFEFKWNPGRKGKFSKTFLNAYPAKEKHTITPDNYDEFLLPVSEG